MIKWEPAKDGEMHGRGVMSHCIVEIEPNSSQAILGYRYIAHAGLETKLCRTQRQAILWCQTLDNDLRL